MWLFLLAARHRMQALSALACSVGCAFLGFASLKIALFIQPHKKVGNPIYFLGHPLFHFCKSLLKILIEYPIRAVMVVFAERPKSSVFEFPKMSESP